MTISALCIFSGDLPENNPDAAAAALRAAGYQVFRPPPELKATCYFEDDDFDDFIEIRREGDADDDSIDAMRADAERIFAVWRVRRLLRRCVHRAVRRTDP
jgi:hypothetical protein